jgi:hypothetical protein
MTEQNRDITVRYKFRTRSNHSLRHNKIGIEYNAEIRIQQSSLRV